MKKNLTHHPQKLTSRGSSDSYVVLGLVMILLFATLLSGIFTKSKKGIGGGSGNIGACCDSGDGDLCKPSTTTKIVFQGSEYGLLKSNINFPHDDLGRESTKHIKHATSVGNLEIFTNDSNLLDATHLQQHNCAAAAGSDLYIKPNTSGLGCNGIPNDQLIYICKNNCTGDPNNMTFDVYFRLSDGVVSDPIRNCGQASPPLSSQTIIVPTNNPNASQKALQFKDIQITIPPYQGEWIMPWCKPAIYLYPQEKTDVTVEVKPIGEMTLTLPAYPTNGWKVTAFPNGKLYTNNATYDYLYYEAKLPSNAIQKPSTGFVVAYNELPLLYQTILPKLGLNTHEQKQFIQYWQNVLPQSPYYFVGVAEESHLDLIAPLIISPKPDTTIRVTLYFEALKEKKAVSPPFFPLVKRTGFTVVEWGGLLKNDKDSNLTCLL